MGPVKDIQGKRDNTNTLTQTRTSNGSHPLDAPFLLRNFNVAPAIPFTHDLGSLLSKAARSRQSPSGVSPFGLIDSNFPVNIGRVTKTEWGTGLSR